MRKWFFAFFKRGKIWFESVAKGPWGIIIILLENFLKNFCSSKWLKKNSESLSAAKAYWEVKWNCLLMLKQAQKKKKKNWLKITESKNLGLKFPKPKILTKSSWSHKILKKNFWNLKLFWKKSLMLKLSLQKTGPEKVLRKNSLSQKKISGA